MFSSLVVWIQFVALATCITISYGMDEMEYNCLVWRCISLSYLGIVIFLRFPQKPNTQFHLEEFRGMN